MNEIIITFKDSWMNDNILHLNKKEYKVLKRWVENKEKEYLKNTIKLFNNETNKK